MGLRFLRDLSRRLTPASLRTGMKDARQHTFVVGARQSGKDIFVEIGPLARIPAERERGVLDFTRGARNFYLAGTLSPTTDGGALLKVESGPAERPPRSRRMAPTTDVAFAISTISAEGGGRRCLPILDIGTRGLRVESATPLEVGTVLSDLVVVFQREVLRSGEGVVTACAPALYPDGRQVYECGIRFRQADHHRADTAGLDRVEIDDIARVRAILWGLCDLEYEVAISGPTGMIRGRMQRSRTLDRQRVPELRCRVEDTDRLPLRSGAVVVECSLFGSGYRFYARIADRQVDVLTLSPSPKLREWHRRSEERTPLAPNSGALVSYRHPLTRVRHVHPLSDMSSRGFSFPPGTSDEELWAGLPLKDVRVHLGDFAFKVADVVVRGTSSERVNVEMRALPDHEADLLREELIQRGPDPIVFHDGRSLDQLIAFHRSVKLLEPDMEANLQASMDEARRTWRLAHGRSVRLMRTAVVPWRGGIGAALSSVRAYERTWMFQHNAVASGSVPAGAGQLHGILMRLAAYRNDGEYIAGIITAAAKAMHGLVSTFFAQSAPAHRGATRLMLFAAPAAAPEAPIDETTIRRLRGRDETLVEHVGRRQFDPVCARALGLVAGEVEIPKTRAIYSKLGIERTREALGAFADDRCVAVLLRETASTGLCLSGLMSAAFLLPVLPGADPDGSRRRALCELARATRVPGDPPQRFLFQPLEADDAPVRAAGFQPVEECTLFALHRFGILEYQRYVADKYGLLQARLRSRVARLPEVAA